MTRPIMATDALAIQRAMESYAAWQQAQGKTPSRYWDERASAGARAEGVTVAPVMQLELADDLKGDAWEPST